MHSSTVHANEKNDDLQERSPQDQYDEELRFAIQHAYMRQLIPLKQDVCMWINSLLYINLSTENFMEDLSDGLLLCNLAQTITLTANQGSNKVTMAGMRHNVWRRAKRRTFFARENITNFLEFCASVGVAKNLLFETEDLVQENNARPVVLCLLELSRLCFHKWNIQPANLVRIELEVDGTSDLSTDDSGVHCEYSDCNSSSLENLHEIGIDSTTLPHADSENRKLPFCIATSKDFSKLSGPENKSRWPSNKEDRKNKDEKRLNVKAREVAVASGKVCPCQHKQCSKAHMHKICDGKYRIYGKIFNVRLLNDNHVMVRVGGGWDTLEHYLLTHQPVAVGTSQSTPEKEEQCTGIRGRYVSPPSDKNRHNKR